MLHTLIKVTIKMEGMKSYTDVQFTNIENILFNASLSFPSTATTAQLLCLVITEVWLRKIYFKFAITLWHIKKMVVTDLNRGGIISIYSLHSQTRLFFGEIQNYLRQKNPNNNKNHQKPHNTLWPKSPKSWETHS